MRTNLNELSTSITKRISKVCTSLAVAACIALGSAPTSFGAAVGNSSAHYNFAVLNITNETYAQSGVSSNEAGALEQMFTRFGWTYKNVSFADLDNGVLETQGQRNFSCLVCPGGFMGPREAEISALGNQNIRQFISDGGGYIGFCAGAFQGVTKMMWADTPNGFNGTLNLLSAYRPHPINLQLFPGAGYGPLAWVPNDKGHRFEVVKINTADPVMQAIGAPPFTQIVYAGGPAFTHGLYDTWAVGQKPADITVPAGTPLVGENWPTIIKFPFGKGQVILCSYHPVVIPGGMINGVQVETALPTVAPLVGTVTPQQLNDFNYQSWNILHAAFQVLLGQAPTKMVIK